MCQQKQSDGASLREEKVCPDCPRTKNRHERGLERLVELSTMFNGSTSRQVLPLNMVDNLTGPFQAHFRPVFGDEAFQRALLFPKQGCMRVLPRPHTPPLSGFGASQAESGNKGHESTSCAVHRRFVLPAAMAGVRCR
jgi:hypothetical protein